jgi:hypothetical protein
MEKQAQQCKFSPIPLKEVNMTTNHNVELIPGTEVMNEDGHAKKTLVPKPSSDPQDPLNWSRKYKRMFVVEGQLNAR